MAKVASRLLDASILRGAVVDSFRKLDPRVQFRNPVMFAVYLGSGLTTLLWVDSLARPGSEPAWFILAVIENRAPPAVMAAIVAWLK